MLIIEYYFSNTSRNGGVDIRSTLNTFNGSNRLSNRNSESGLVNIKMNNITQFTLSVIRDTDFSDLNQDLVNEEKEYSYT